MEGHMSKRKRIYSLEPKKTVEAAFVRKYVSHLVPALMKISKKALSSSSADEEGGLGLEKIVRYEVDMALALSAQKFAWSHALKNRLQLNVNVGKFHCYLHIDDDHHHHWTSLHSTALLTSSLIPAGDQSAAVCAKPTPMPKAKKLKRPQKVEMQVGLMEEKEDGAETLKGDDEEEEQLESKMMNLRSILPGGSEMEEDEMLSEVGNYIACLKLQVKILRCMVETAD